MTDTEGKIVQFVGRVMSPDDLTHVARNWSRFCDRFGVPLGASDEVAEAIEAKIEANNRAAKAETAKIGGALLAIITGLSMIANVFAGVTIIHPLVGSILGAAALGFIAMGIVASKN